jgi:aspartate-semialdehyde dehydrogenase
MSTFVSEVSSVPSYDVGIVGATGAVGIELIKCLFIQKFPLTKLHLYASKRSVGKVVSSDYGELVIEEYIISEVRKCKIVFLAVSGDFALENAKLLIEGDGPIVIDNSSAFRYDVDIPLVVRDVASLHVYSILSLLGTYVHYRCQRSTLINWSMLN